MKYIVFKSGEFEMYDNILKSDGVYDYFTPRLKRDRTVPIWQGGYLKIEDRKFEKFLESIGKFAEKSIRAKVTVGRSIEWRFDKLGKFLIDRFSLSRIAISDGHYVDYKHHVGGRTIEEIADAEIKEIKISGIVTGFNLFGQTYGDTGGIANEYNNRTKFKDKILQIGMLNVYKPHSELIVDDYIISKSRLVDKFDNLFCLRDCDLTGSWDNFAVARFYDDTCCMYAESFYKDNTFIVPFKILNEIYNVANTPFVGLTDKYKEYNHMRMVDNKTVEYIQESRLSRFNGNFNDPDLRAKFCQKTSVMKMIKACFMLKDSQIEVISNNLDFDDNDFSDIQIISGERITWAYGHGATVGTIGSSCMRHDKHANKFKLYEKNAQMVAIIKNDIVMARALLWEITNIKSGQKIKMMDRIYVSNDKIIGKFKNYANQNGWAYLERQGAGMEFAKLGAGSIRLADYYVQLEGDNYAPYPYVDTWHIKAGNRAYVKTPAISMRNL